jgi:hypothetical protein
MSPCEPLDMSANPLAVLREDSLPVASQTEPGGRLTRLSTQRKAAIDDRGE